ncbi:MAG TPA: hypothetical protein VF503_15685 [Sphingobium sp.]|uniref:hypothetical protein n=1 Tax=Sphingobium sp. TaxID=1912891 RepID=UPI002ED10029
MLRKIIQSGAVGAVVLTASAPTIASAQNYGVWFSSGGPTYDYPRGPVYYDRGYDEDRREAWLAHEREEQRERWERDEARRRYWQHEQWEHHHERHGDDDDD